MGAKRVRAQGSPWQGWGAFGRDSSPGAGMRGRGGLQSCREGSRDFSHHEKGSLKATWTFNHFLWKLYQGPSILLQQNLTLPCLLRDDSRHCCFPVYERSADFDFSNDFCAVERRGVMCFSGSISPLRWRWSWSFQRGPGLSVLQWSVGRPPGAQHSRAVPTTGWWLQTQFTPSTSHGIRLPWHRG